MDLYYTSIGRGSPLNLGLAINPEGKVSKADSLALINFRTQVNLEFETNLATNAKVTASNIRGNSEKYKAVRSTDDLTETFWATDDGIIKADIKIDFGKETSFNRLLLQEFIALGQRIHSFSFEAETKNGWQEIISGTTVGYKRVLKFDEVTARKVRLSLKTEAPCLILSNLGIFNAPPLTVEPKIERSIIGTVSLISEDNHDIFYKVNSSDFQKYSGPVSLPKGGKIDAYAVDKSDKSISEIVSKEFGMAKNKWSIHETSSVKNDDFSANFAIDGNPKSLWISKEKNSNHHISINLDKEILISGFSYLPCKEGCDGTIYKYEFYTSANGKNWIEKSSGEFSNIENNPTEQIVKFDTPTKTKYVKLLSKSAIKNSKRASVAEIEIFTIN